MFDVRCLMFGVQCSTFGVRRSTFSVRRSTVTEVKTVKTTRQGQSPMWYDENARKGAFFSLTQSLLAS